MTLPSYSAISFHSKEEHRAALYDACLLIVNTYNQTDMLDDYGCEIGTGYTNVSAYGFMKFARQHGQGAWRSMNIHSISRIRSRGKTYTF